MIQNNKKPIELVKLNKESLRKLLQTLEQRGTLVQESMEDYEIIGGPIQGGQASIVISFLKGDPQQQLKAIKRIAFDIKEKLQFFKEIEILSAIKHENIISVDKIFVEKSGADEDEFTINVVMPYVARDFISWMVNNQEVAVLAPKSTKDIPDNKRSFEEIRDALIGTLKGIDQLHLRDFIHLDIKFSNILIDSKNNALVVDLGSAQSKGGFETSQTASICYTPIFVAPEVLAVLKDGKAEELPPNESISQSFEVNIIEKVDYFTNKADMYSFGVMLYKLFIHETEDIDMQHITRHAINARILQLFSGAEAPALLVEDLETIIKNLLQANKQLRFDAGTLLYQRPFFNKLLDQLPSKPQPSSPLFDVAPEEDAETKFMRGLTFLEGIGIPMNVRKARSIFEKISDEFAPAKYLAGWMLETSYGGPMAKEKGLNECKISAKDAYPFFKECLDSERAEVRGLGCFAIANMLQKGHFVAKDGKLGAEYMRRAAMCGNSIAEYIRGARYYGAFDSHFDEVMEPDFLENKDLKNAAKYLERSASKGNPMAQTLLSMLLEKNLKDVEAAVKYLRLASDQGYSNAQNILAWRLSRQNNVQEAIRLYDLAIAQGLPSAMFNLGALYDKGETFGIPTDTQRAANLYKQAAELGHKNAMFSFGFFCELEKDYKSAMAWYTKSAELGYVPTFRGLGYIYEKGGCGQKKDLEASLYYYHLGADAKDPTAMQAIGQMYRTGTGVKKDLQEALRWFNQGAKYGGAKAMFSLGELYEYGEGVEQNMDVAIDWYKRSAELSCKPAQNKLRKMGLAFTEKKEQRSELADQTEENISG